MSHGGFLTLQEAASSLGTTVTRVLVMLRLGKLFGVMTGDEWLVDRRSIERRRGGRHTPAILKVGCGPCRLCRGSGE